MGGAGSGDSDKREDKPESLQETPSSARTPLAPALAVKRGGVTRRPRQAQQAPHTGLHFHFYGYFLNSWGAVSARYYVLESKVLLKSLQVCLEKAGEKADVT